MVATARTLDVLSSSADRRAGCLGGECRLAFDPGRPRTLRGCRVVGGIGLQSWLRWIAPGRREVGRCRGHREAARLERGGLQPGEPHRRSLDGMLGTHSRPFGTWCHYCCGVLTFDFQDTV